jgi:hypothetical protein
MTLSGSNVGIGKTNPVVALDVTGAVKATTTIAAGTTITANGKSVPTSDEPNLKIIRGSVNTDGTIASGEGFTVNKNPSINGLYRITFTDSFNDNPVVTTSLNGRRALTVHVYQAGLTAFPADNTASLPSLGGFTAGVLDVNATNAFNFGFSFIAVGER